ncbi:T9SS type A sorting domain-containing protein [bacterium]|nr:T9SS type A sorting domain-containing protein [bacterium]
MKKAWFFLLLCFSPAFGTTYYVAPDGLDSQPGSLTYPWGTIQHAADELLPGDTVLIRGGVYHEQVITDHGGSAAEGPISFRAYPGEIPILDGYGVTTGNNGIIIGHSYIHIKGLEIRNWNDNGIWAEGAGYLEISDCEVHNVTYGIGFSEGTHDFELNRVVIHHFDLYGFDATPGSTPCCNGVLNDCVSHTGRDPDANVDGFALGHGEQRNFQLNRCVAYGVYDGFDISSRVSTLNGCLAYDCWNGCYKLWQDSVYLYNCIGYDADGAIVELDWDDEPGSVTLMNCTFFHGETYIVWVENPGDELYMYNCILSGGDNIGLAFESMGVTNYHGNYNIFHTNDGYRTVAVGYTDEFSSAEVEAGDWNAYSGEDEHSMVVYSPEGLFEDAEGNDFHLPPTSPAIDRGTSLGAPPIDFDNMPRPYGGGYDIGAFEYNPTVIAQDYEDPVRNFELLAAPNPFSEMITVKYSLPWKENIEVTVCDLLGKEVLTLVKSVRGPGCASLIWHGQNKTGDPVPPGVYLIRLRANDHQNTQKIIKIK